MGKRRKAREIALQALFQADFHESDYRESLAIFWKEQSQADDVLEFANQLVRGVLGTLPEIDGMIEACSDHWRVHRMSRVDRSILRLSAYELAAIPEIPFKVTIDEAIELGKKYGTSESGAFINGILDNLSKNILNQLKDKKAGDRKEKE